MNSKISFYSKLTILFFSTAILFGLLFGSTANSQIWEQTNGPDGGCIWSLAINSSGDIFAGTFEAGIFRSTNNGNSWTKINTGLTNDFVLAIAFNSSGDIFAGTYGGGVFRSTDNGDNWTEINNGLTNSLVFAIAINSSDDIFAGTHGGVFRSTDNGDNWTRINNGLTNTWVWDIAINSSEDIFAGINGGGVFRSTDNGDNWIEVNSGLTNTNIKAIAINSSGDIFAGTSGGVFRSIDNGDNWTVINTGLTYADVNDIAISSSNDIFAGTYGNGVFRSTDNGDNWIEVNSGLTNTYVEAIAINSSGDIFTGIWGGGVFRSTDNGDNWTKINNGLTNALVSAISINSSGDIYTGTSGGVFRSTDNGDNWTDISNGLPYYSEVHAIAISSSNDIFAGIRDYGVFRSTNNGNSWAEINTGLTNFYIQAITINSSGDIFVGTSGVFRSTDNGDSWVEINNGLTNIYVNALAINSSGDIFAGTGGGVFRSEDNGDNWTEINTGLISTNVFAIAINSSGDIFVGTYGGDVFRSTDNGDNWTKINNGLTNAGVWAIGINTSGDIFAGTGGGGVFLSTDNGDSWAEINNGLTNTGVLAIAINSSDDIFAGTGGGGVFRLLYSEICEDMAFRPNPDGWVFGNTANNMWPFGWYPSDPLDERCTCDLNPVSRCFPTWSMFRDAFGADQTENQNGSPLPNAKAKWERIKDCWGGSSFGFAISAFLFFDGYLDVATEFPGSTDLYNVPIGNDSRSMVNEYWIYQFGRAQQRHINNNYRQTAPNQTLQACKDMFSSSITPRNDRILVFYNNNGDGGHAVNPYRCEVDESNSDLTHVYIYDNNAPNDETRRITFNTNLDTWAYTNMSTWGGSLHIFLMDPISNYTTNPVLPKEILPQERWIRNENRINSEYVEFYFQSTDTVRIESSLGEIGQIGDSLFSNLSDGCPIIPITGEETPPIGYFLPNTEWAAQVTGHKDTSFCLTMFTDSTVLKYERDNVNAEDIESLGYLGNDSSLTVHNKNQSDISYSIDIISVLADSQIVCGIRGISTGADDSISYTITDGSGLKVDNFGDESNYAVRIQLTGPLLDTVFYCESVPISANCSHVIIPDWREDNDSLQILVDLEMSGQFEDTLSLHNQGEPPQFICGDVNTDVLINILDIVYLINYKYKGGPAPNPLESGDVNSDELVNILDIVYLINYKYKDGPNPVCP